MPTYGLMRSWLCTLVVAVFAVLAAGFQGAPAEADLRILAAESADRAASGMADCEHCTAEEATSMAAACGSFCAPSAVA